MTLKTSETNINCIYKGQPRNWAIKVLTLMITHT